MRFTKMHGCGNDYVYIDGFAAPFQADAPSLARRASDRHFGVGSDGLILILPSEKADARMRMYNADGSEAEMCGNGLRCVAKYVHDHGIARKDRLRIETGRGVLAVDLEVKGGVAERVRVNMGRPIFDRAAIPVAGEGARCLRERVTVDGIGIELSAVSMGNPHAVVFLDEPPGDALVHGLGPKLERHPLFPRRTNVEFARVVARDRIALRVWERGAGETLACGTGACATAVLAAELGHSARRAAVDLPGGTLEIDWSDPGDVFMTGPAVEVFTGDLPE